MLTSFHTASIGALTFFHSEEDAEERRLLRKESVEVVGSRLRERRPGVPRETAGRRRLPGEQQLHPGYHLHGSKGTSKDLRGGIGDFILLFFMRSMGELVNVLGLCIDDRFCKFPPF
jgi:hypothetical protein